MSNPLLDRHKHIFTYLMVWVLIAGIHFILIFSFYDVPFLISVVDSLVFNILYALLAIIIWYPVRYNNPEGKITFKILISYLAIGSFFIPVWLFLGYMVIKQILAGSEVYFRFLNESFVARIATGLLYYGVTILVYHLFIYSQALEEKRLNETKLNLLVRESELNVLRSQLNPHFLFNSLNSISSLTISDPDTARDMIIKLSEFLRYALKYGQRDRTFFSEELKNIGLYLDIEKIRFGKRLEFEENINEGCMKAMIPNMILQPLIENAIKHGVYESTETITISLTCKPVNEGVKVILRNNFDPSVTRRKGTGTGLKNVGERLMLIYNNNNLLTVRNEENIFEVSLLIPQTT